MPSFPVSLDLGANGGVYHFKDQPELEQFVTTENVAWDFARAQPFSNMSDNEDTLRVLGQARRAQGYLNNMRANPASFNADGLLQELRNVYASSGFPTTKSPKGAFVLDLKSKIGPKAAFGALAVFLNSRFDSRDPGILRGAIAAADFEGQLTGISKRATQESLTSALKRAGELQVEAASRASALSAEIAEIERTRSERFRRFIRHARGARRRFMQGVQSEADQIVDALAQTEKAYKEQMGLSAPVEYWREKSREHDERAKILQWVGLGYAAAVIIYLMYDGIWRIISLAEEVSTRTHLWQMSYVVLTVALIILTIIFWIGRLLSRIFLSEQHLAIDAAERATMAQTYLALTNDGKIEPSERSLVLTALFRPSSDGIVRDDGSPDISLASLISRVTTGPSPAKGI